MLIISRVVTALVLVGSGTLAWFVIDMNVTLLIWAGVGGFVAALAGPLVLGSIWKGVTSRGALLGFWVGVVVFILIHSELVSFVWPSAESLRAAGEWFALHARSPYSAATMGAIAGVLATIVVSKLGDRRDGG